MEPKDHEPIVANIGGVDFTAAELETLKKIASGSKSTEPEQPKPTTGHKPNSAGF